MITVSHGDLRTGFWCDRCLTSAGVEWDVYVLAADGPLQLGTIRRCGRCDS